MNSVLRKVARRLKYRPLPELVGTKVTIQSAKSAPAHIGAVLQKTFPFHIQFSDPKEPWISVGLAKYRMLNLTFRLDGVEWQSSDSGGISTLQELGFIIRSDQVSEEVWKSMSEDEDPTCLKELYDEITQSQVLLRLFIEEDPRTPLLEYMNETMRAGKGHLFSGGIAEMEALLEGFFPHKMVVTDACLSNAGFVWFHRHFHL